MRHRSLIVLAFLAAAVGAAAAACSTTNDSSMRRLMSGNCDPVLSTGTSCIQPPGRSASNSKTTHR